MVLSVLLKLLFLSLPTAAEDRFGENMITEPYKIANAEDDSYSTVYADEYFEVYSKPIRTLYSQVHWRMHEPVPIPDDVVIRFRDKVMAITGYEVDQVRVNEKGMETSVPITWSYNHHYLGFLFSNKTKLVKSNETHDTGHHGGYWTASSPVSSSSNAGIPHMTVFSEGNGGEFRLSYHGYPRGYAQLIQSPTHFQFNPMSIDTWNRDSNTSKFKPGAPLPKASRIPPNAAGYSGLLECPCSDRLERKWSTTYVVNSTDSRGEDECVDPVDNATECYYGAKRALSAPRFRFHDEGSSATDSHCTVEQHEDGTVDIKWTSNDFVARQEVEEPVNSWIAYNDAQVNVTAVLSGKDGDNDNYDVTFTLVGPADVWFGVAFGANTMCLHNLLVTDECPQGGPYAIVVSGEDVTERKLDFHGPGQLVNISMHVQSNKLINGGLNRTVVLATTSRAQQDRFVIDPKAKAPLPMIAARGCGMEFAQHCGHAPSQLTFMMVDSPARICSAGVSGGTIGGNVFSNKGRCVGDLAAQDNPTCQVQTYAGGLACCRDGESLLDKDQEIPWPDKYLEMRFRFRFYFQDYQPALKGELSSEPSHQSLVRLYWMTETFAGEYDVPQCPRDVPRDQCVHMLTSKWQVRDMLQDCPLERDGGGWCTGSNSKSAAGIELIYAGPHCHAPACLSMDLYNADTGQLLCHSEPVAGESDYEIYKERGFLAIPPCLWGNEEGLVSPQFLSINTTLLSIKRNNNTFPHTGEMASWQMRGVVIPQEDSLASAGRI